MRIFLLPGMGADASMYGPAFRAIPGVVLLDWPPYAGEESIRDVARRVILENNIGPEDVVGGSSLGGIVAAEIERLFPFRGLISIGSALTPESLRPILRKAGRFAPAAPIGIITYISKIIGGVLKSPLLKMFGKSEGEFIKAMCRAIPLWEGNPNPTCETLRIHGARDRVILPPAKGAERIADGGHLIAMTHEPLVVDIILRHLFRPTNAQAEKRPI